MQLGKKNQRTLIIYMQWGEKKPHILIIYIQWVAVN